VGPTVGGQVVGYDKRLPCSPGFERRGGGEKFGFSGPPVVIERPEAIGDDDMAGVLLADLSQGYNLEGRV